MTSGSEAVGFFIGPDDYEAMFGAAVRELLETRMTGSTVGQDELCEGIQRPLQNRRSS